MRPAGTTALGRLLTGLLLSCLALTACGAEGPQAATAAGPTTGPRLQVSAAFYPLAFLASRVGGDAVAVTTLTAPGAEPHDLELTPSQVADLSRDDLVVYLAGFQPAVDEAVAQQAGAFDVSTVTPLVSGAAEGAGKPDEPGLDPHVWLDPLRYAAIGDAVAARMERLVPGQAQAIRARAAQLRTDLSALDAQFRTGLADCARKQIVTSHAAFGYLASAYGLEQVSITGLAPDEEASPGRLAEVARYAERHGVTTVFFEGLVSPRVARSLADEVGAKAVELDPIEGAPASGDYFTQMRADLAALRAALGCP